MLSMAKRITNEDIEKINEAYLFYGTYAAAARAVGCSPSTARKYVIEGYKAKGENSIEEKPIEISELGYTLSILQNCNHLSCLRDFEKAGMNKIWKEMNF